MTTFHKPYHFLQQTRDTQTTFFPVPEAEKERLRRRRKQMLGNIDPFTGVPSGFYRAFAMKSPLALAPSIMQNTLAEGIAHGDQLRQEDETVMDFLDTSAENISFDPDRPHTPTGGHRHEGEVYFSPEREQDRPLDTGVRTPTPRPRRSSRIAAQREQGQHRRYGGDGGHGRQSRPIN